MDQVRLCGDCEAWKPWPCSRINTHRYGTCTIENVTTKRVTFCLLIDRKLDEPNPHQRPLTARQQQVWDLHQQGKSYREISDTLGISPQNARSVLVDVLLKQRGLSRKRR